MLALRPTFWEYWLYAGALRLSLQRLEPKYRDYEMKFAPMTSGTYLGRDAFEFLRTAPANASALVASFNAVLKSGIQTRAFGEPGEPGDPDRILHMAARFIDVYEGLLDEAARIRGAALPEDFRVAQNAAAEFGGEAIAEFRDFVGRCVAQMEQLPELMEAHSGDEPFALTLTITLTVDDAVAERFVEGLRSGVEKLSSSS